VWSGAFTTSQSYNLAGGVTGKSHPSTRTLSYSYDADGDLTTFSGTLGDGINRTYASGIQYNAQGQMIREQFGTTKALYHRRHYNSRGQMFDVRLGTDSSTVNDGADPAAWTGKSWNYGALRLYYSSNQTDYSWPFTTSNAPQNNNGNLYRQDHFVPTALDGSDNITAWGMGVDYYGYDSLNRVTGVTEQTYDSAGGFNPGTFSQQFSYDRFGNRLVSSSNVPNVPNPGFKINGPTNRLIAPTDVDGSNASDKMRYDAAGNQIKDTHTQTGTTGTRAYDAENRMTAADGTNGLANGYVYNADGKRTRRSIDGGSAIWWHVYGIGGELVAEYRVIGGVPTLKKEYGYRNGELLVVWDGDETGDKRWQWRVTDQLGTARMLVDLSGAFGAMKRRDYLPFGEEVLAGVGHRTIGNGYPGTIAANPRQHFVGYERDTETDLDFAEARYYPSVQGRFISPDPLIASARRQTPQSWNRYSYAINNPLKYVDPSGEAWIAGPGGSTFWDPDVSTADEIRKKYGKRYSLIDGQTRVITASNHPGFKKGNSYTFNKDGTVTDHGVYAPPAPVELPRSRYGDQMALALVGLYGQAALAAVTGGGSLLGATAGAISIAADYALDEEAPDPQTIAMAASVQANKAAGDAFRDEVADALEQAGRVVEKEKTFDTPFGPRRVDIHVKDASGNVLGGVETKVGSSRYRASQRAKDAYLRIIKKYLVHVIRRR
jgi:RHS repeat-associated protein